MQASVTNTVAARRRLQALPSPTFLWVVITPLALGCTRPSSQSDVACNVLDALEAQFLEGHESDREAVLAIKDWRTFYKTLQTFAPPEMERLLIQRVSDELALTQAQHLEFVRILNEEKAAVTGDAIARFGQDRLFAVLDLPKPKRASFVRRLAEEREIVRRRFDEDYCDLVGPRNLPFLNEHLRSPYIGLLRNTGDRSVSVIGVGSLRFLYASEAKDLRRNQHEPVEASHEEGDTTK